MMGIESKTTEILGNNLKKITFHYDKRMIIKEMENVLSAEGEEIKKAVEDYFLDLDDDIDGDDSDGEESEQEKLLFYLSHNYALTEVQLKACSYLKKTNPNVSISFDPFISNNFEEKVEQSILLFEYEDFEPNGYKNLNIKVDPSVRKSYEKFFNFLSKTAITVYNEEVRKPGEKKIKDISQIDNAMALKMRFNDKNDLLNQLHHSSEKIYNFEILENTQSQIMKHLEKMFVGEIPEEYLNLEVKKFLKYEKFLSCSVPFIPDQKNEISINEMNQFKSVLRTYLNCILVAKKIAQKEGITSNLEELKIEFIKYLSEESPITPYMHLCFYDVREIALNQLLLKKVAYFILKNANIEFVKGFKEKLSLPSVFSQDFIKAFDSLTDYNYIKYE